MSYQQTIENLANDPEELELAYRAAVSAGDDAAFRAAIDTARAAAPENLLYAAWFYRLRDAAIRTKEAFIAWPWAIPLALINGLLFWILSDDQRFMVQIRRTFGGVQVDYLPLVLLVAAPLAAVFVLVYLAAAGQKRWRLAAVIGVVLLAAAGYVTLVYPRLVTRPFQEQYLTLMTIHLPLLAWAGVGAFLVAARRDPANRFAFLIKSLEVFIMGGLLVIAGGLFTAITVGLFSALSVEVPTIVQRLLIAGGGGLIPVIAVAVIYNARETPAGQSFEEGLSKLIALLMRILLPLTLLVLVIYLAFIPFNFREPFDNRDVLIIYNAMLFAVITLLVGATPVNRDALDPRLARWLRGGIIAVAALALIISVYALVAIVYRTAIDRPTPNRVAFIGWNVINIFLLVGLLYNQWRDGAAAWLNGLYKAFAAGTVAYTVWTAFVILAVPWLFGGDQKAIETLPRSVQFVVYDNPAPILLKCRQSPHIYLLEGGQKRWVDTIATFEARGYVWRDVYFVPCEDLRLIPDGATIPADAGPPPQP